MYRKLFIRGSYFPKLANQSQKANHNLSKWSNYSLLQVIYSRVKSISILLLISVFLNVHLHAQILKKTISIEIKNEKIQDAVEDVAKMAKVRLVFERHIWPDTKISHLSFKNKSVDEILKEILKSTNLSFQVINDQFIIIKENIDPKKKENKTTQNNVDKINENGYLVEGYVTDENDAPLVGVNINVEDGSQMAVTDKKGFYNIGVNKPQTKILFKFVGYQNMERTVNYASTQNIKMKADPANLDEVIIVGYGTTTKRYNTGAQVGISAKDIQNQPVTNVLQSLEGRLAGVFVTQTNGLPGAGINISIRGTNSLNKSNRPLYVIDGVPYLSEPINTTSSTTSVLPSAEGSTSPLNSISPSDIENIEVLKDADATAIYGSRGANGVVLITTKKGKAGITSFNANVTHGFSKVGHFVDMLSTDAYLKLRQEAFDNGSMGTSATPSATNAPDLTVWDQTANTNWQKKLLGKTAQTSDYNSSISGGNATTNFYLGGNYHKEDNVFPGSQNYQRGGMNLNLNHSSLNNRFTLAFSAIYTTDKNNISTTDLASYAFSLPPNFQLYNSDGSLYWLPGAIGSLPNPLGYLEQKNDNRTNNLLANLIVKYTLAKGLDFKTSVGYNKAEMDQTTLRPLTSLSAAYSVPTSGTSSFTSNRSKSYIVEPQLTYKTNIWKGEFNGLVGATYQDKESNQPYYIFASGFSSDAFLNNISSATTVTTTSSSQSYKYASLLGRLNYNLMHRYIVNFNIRRDGSSRFGANNKFGNFGSLGAAWLFTNEGFLKNKLSWLSFGKLRGSYGIVGSDEIGNYQYLSSYASSAYVYNGVTGLSPSRIANADFKWESTKKLEIGLELGFFHDRLSFNGSYYQNRTNNQLLSYPLSGQTGFTTYQSNLPATVQNSGLEFTLNSSNIKTKNFTWTSSFNISRNRNKLISFPNILNTSYYSVYVVGNPISAYNLYQFIGISESTNLPVFTDFKNGTGVTSTPVNGFSATGVGDKYYAGTSLPSFYGGLTNTINYKDFTLDFTFQFVKQKGRSLASSYYYPPGYINNLPTSVANEYLSLGDENYLVAGGTSTTKGLAAYRGYSYYSNSDATLVDASYIRMKNINISYNLSNKICSRLNIQSVRVFLQGQNLFTITKFKGIDPESQGMSTPPLKTIVCGLQFSL